MHFKNENGMEGISIFTVNEMANIKVNKRRHEWSQKSYFAHDSL